MNEQERQAAYIEALNELSARYGFQVIAQVQARPLGPVVQCEAQLVVQPIAGWKAPESPARESPNGKLVLADAEIEATLRPGSSE